MERQMNARIFGVALAISGTMLLADAAQANPEYVSSPGSHAAGTIIVKTGERRLYLITGDGGALRYPVGVGRAGKQWQGTAQIDGKYLKPAWSPPSEVRR